MLFRTVDHGETPYLDYPIEYPPVAWWTTYVPRFLDSRPYQFGVDTETNQSIYYQYSRAYKLEMALFDLAAFGLFLAIVRKRRPKLLGIAAITYVVTSAILCHILYNYLDEGTLFF